MKCVEYISRLTGLLGGCDGLLWELDLRKCVHGALDSVAADSLIQDFVRNILNIKIIFLTGILFRVSATILALSA